MYCDAFVFFSVLGCMSSLIFDEQSIRSFAHITRGDIMASDVRREANEDRLKRR